MRVCEAPDCDSELDDKRASTKYCSATCRSRAARSQKAAAAEVEHVADPDDETGKAEHTLISTVRQTLVDADALGTVAGQLALQMARRIANPETAGISAMAKELRVLLVEARAEAAGDEPADAPAPSELDEDDEVTRARSRREEARKAAGFA